MIKGPEWPLDLDCPWLVDPLGCLGPPWLMLLHQFLKIQTMHIPETFRMKFDLINML